MACWKNVESFKSGIPRVDTLTTVDYGLDWGVLRGKLTHMGGALSCEIWFEYGSSAHNLNKKTGKQTMASTGEFTTVISGLSECGVCYYRAVVSNDVGTTYGSTLSFTLGAPIVKTDHVDSVEEHSATLKGGLIHLGGASSCQVWFEYGTSEDNLDKQTVKQTLTSAGGFGKTLTNLNSATRYYFRAVADNGLCISYGDTLDFWTK